MEEASCRRGYPPPSARPIVLVDNFRRSTPLPLLTRLLLMCPIIYNFRSMLSTGKGKGGRAAFLLAASSFIARLLVREPDGLLPPSRSYNYIFDAHAQLPGRWTPLDCKHIRLQGLPVFLPIRAARASARYRAQAGVKVLRHRPPSKRARHCASPSTDAGPPASPLPVAPGNPAVDIILFCAGRVHFNEHRSRDVRNSLPRTTKSSTTTSVP